MTAYDDLYRELKTARPGLAVADMLDAFRAEVRAAVLRELEDKQLVADSCDAEGCAIPHSPGCERAIAYAAEHDGCTCGRPWEDTPQPHAAHCWTVKGGSDRYREAVAAEAVRAFVERTTAALLAVDPVEWALAGQHAGHDAANLIRRLAQQPTTPKDTP